MSTMALPATRPLRLSVAPVARTTNRPALRLTRRGQLVVVAIVALVALAFFGLGRASAGDGHALGSPAAATVTVNAGDTLWTLSQRTWPHSDPRDGVRRLVQVNHLREGATLLPGAVLATR